MTFFLNVFLYLYILFLFLNVSILSQYKEANETDCVLNLAQAEHDAQPRRVLVCAPSNAAIDEILKRLTADPENGGGVFDSQGERYNPAVRNVLRIVSCALSSTRCFFLGRSCWTKCSS